ncbi:MAG: MMPL family transporter [Clostridiales bacterium]|nr:MMPL family transporter [Clostridiales bacterium]
MIKLARFLITHRKTVIIFFSVLCIVSILMLPMVKVNYDLTKYLPEDTGTTYAFDIVREQFGYPGTAEVMADNVTIPEALEMKNEISSLDGVLMVLWLDDIADINTPLEYLGSDVTKQYYKDSKALFTVQFKEGDSDKATVEALEEIERIIGEGGAIRGSAQSSRSLQRIISAEVGKIVLIVVPVCIGILLFMTRSWLEPFLYLAVLGVSILINMGTNAFFEDVSFITFSMSAVLQLAISMDYSIFLVHRYMEKRESGLEVDEAIVIATKEALSSISSSALTTVAGFVALTFMQYKIGADLGIVLAKGVVLSLVTVVLLMPVVIKISHKTLEKTSHRAFMPDITKLGKFMVKGRYIILALILIVTVPAYLASNANSFVYGETNDTGEEIAEMRAKIAETFGESSPVVVLLPVGNEGKEAELAKALAEDEYVKSVQCLATIAGTAIPYEILPAGVEENFRSEEYSRMIVTFNVAGENEHTERAVSRLREYVGSYYDTYYLAGAISSTNDIKTTVESDYKVVQFISIGAVFLIILVTFRALLLPVLLVLVIQISTWINMGIPYFAGSQLSFIGYLIISAIQLGATIDYAILMSDRYLEFRETMDKSDAAAKALSTSGVSIITSALILTLAGYSYGIVSTLPAISEMGLLLGRGAALSGGMVLLVLPQLLVLFDKPIRMTILRKREGKSK